MSYRENSHQRQFDALPVTTRLDILKAGAQGFKMTPPRPGESSGEISTEIMRREATVTNRYGDPRTWASKFMFPMKHHLVSIRAAAQSHDTWRAQADEREANIQKYNSPFAPSERELSETWLKANGQ